jgi:hypothetical protein
MLAIREGIEGLAHEWLIRCENRGPVLVQVQIRSMVPVVCPLRFVQGYRCSACPWATLLPDCHVPWAVPFCELVKCYRSFEEHRCVAREECPLRVLQ